VFVIKDKEANGTINEHMEAEQAMGTSNSHIADIPRVRHLEAGANMWSVGPADTGSGGEKHLVLGCSGRVRQTEQGRPEYTSAGGWFHHLLEKKQYHRNRESYVQLY